jgi:hypothetical protein
LFVTLRDKGDRPKDSEKGKRLSQQEFMSLARGEIGKIKDVSIVWRQLHQ